MLLCVWKSWSSFRRGVYTHKFFPWASLEASGKTRAEPIAQRSRQPGGWEKTAWSTTHFPEPSFIGSKTLSPWRLDINHFCTQTSKVVIHAGRGPCGGCAGSDILVSCLLPYLAFSLRRKSFKLLGDGKQSHSSMGYRQRHIKTTEGKNSNSLPVNRGSGGCFEPKILKEQSRTIPLSGEPPEISTQDWTADIRQKLATRGHFY